MQTGVETGVLPTSLSSIKGDPMGRTVCIGEGGNAIMTFVLGERGQFGGGSVMVWAGILYTPKPR